MEIIDGPSRGAPPPFGLGARGFTSSTNYGYFCQFHHELRRVETRQLPDSHPSNTSSRRTTNQVANSGSFFGRTPMHSRQLPTATVQVLVAACGACNRIITRLTPSNCRQLSGDCRTSGVVPPTSDKTWSQVFEVLGFKEYSRSGRFDWALRARPPRPRLEPPVPCVYHRKDRRTPHRRQKRNLISLHLAHVVTLFLDGAFPPMVFRRHLVHFRVTCGDSSVHNPHQTPTSPLTKAGFRPGHSTTDHLYTFQQLRQKAAEWHQTLLGRSHRLEKTVEHFRQRTLREQGMEEPHIQVPTKVYDQQQANVHKDVKNIHMYLNW